MSFFKTIYNFEIINIRAIYSQQIFNSEEISSMFSGESPSQNYFIAVLPRSVRSRDVRALSKGFPVASQ